MPQRRGLEALQKAETIQADPTAIELAQHGVIDPNWGVAGGMPLGPSDVGGIMGAVAGVRPEHIRDLRFLGEQMLEQLKKLGLEARLAGSRPMTQEGFARVFGREKGWFGRRKPKTSYPPIQESDYVPNIPVPQIMQDALEFAQKRWPRIFGHQAEITDVDIATKMKHPTGTVWGQSSPAEVIIGAETPTPYEGQGFSLFGLNSKAEPAVVGHELLHSTDRIVDPLFDQKYEFTQGLPGGYEAQSQEIRAQLMGDEFARQFAAWMKRKANAPKNAVPMDPGTLPPEFHFLEPEKVPLIKRRKGQLVTE